MYQFFGFNSEPQDNIPWDEDMVFNQESEDYREPYGFAHTQAYDMSGVHLGVRISNYEDENEWRQIRLATAIEELPAATRLKLQAVHDHKGVMTAWWSETSLQDMKLLEGAWSHVHEEIVVHKGSLPLRGKMGFGRTSRGQGAYLIPVDPPVIRDIHHMVTPAPRRGWN